MQGVLTSLSPSHLLCIIMKDLLMCLYFITLAAKQRHCLSVFRSLKTQWKEWSQHVTEDILQIFVQAVHLASGPFYGRKKSEGWLISTISTRMRKHFSEVACHEDGAVKTIDWLLDAAELFGKGAAACCYLPAFAMLPASMVIHSALLHLDRHPTKVQIFRQETFSPCSGQAF